MNDEPAAVVEVPVALLLEAINAPPVPLLILTPPPVPELLTLKTLPLVLAYDCVRVRTFDESVHTPLLAIAQLLVSEAREPVSVIVWPEPLAVRLRLIFNRLPV